MAHIKRYDIIPDIHACAGRLTATLEALDYRHRSGVWQHPKGRIAAFLGDFIDGGLQNQAVIKAVRKMVESGHAVAIMGNHELNALHYHARGEAKRDPEGSTQDGFMRLHDNKNCDQHKAFLSEYPLESDRAQGVLSWFLNLPLFLELDGIRLVHACWDARHIELIRSRRPDGRLKAEDLQEVALEQTEFAKAVVNLLKGPEAQLPPGHVFHDYGGAPRTEVRIKWWAEPGATWREAALSVKDSAELPDSQFDGELDVTLYHPDAPPVFFGHYKREGVPQEPDALNVMCLDYPSSACAYRWDGEAKLVPDGLLLV